jgi:hypothetical protein
LSISVSSHEEKFFDYYRWRYWVKGRFSKNTGDGQYQPADRIATTVLPREAGAAQNSAQATISRRRLSSRSPRA